MIQEQKLAGQIASINNEIAHLNQARQALTDAFKSGQLHSVSDARGIVRSVKRELEKDFNSGLADFEVDKHF